MTDRQPATAGTRVLVAAVLALAVGVAAASLTTWQAAVLLAWDSAAASFLLWIWRTIGPMDADRTRRLAVREDSSRAASDIMLLLASVGSLIGVGTALIKGNQMHGDTEGFLVGLGVVSIMLAWGVVHSVFTLRYAHLYYGGTPGGIDFNEHDPPRYVDFAYLAFTVGMTYQVSDTNIETKPIRATILRQALLSYVFGTVIVAMTINVVAGLFK